jgi:hypothetical protein
MFEARKDNRSSETESRQNNREWIEEKENRDPGNQRNNPPKQIENKILN